MAAVSERILYAKIKESLSEEFEDNGFEVFELYSNVAGKRAIVAVARPLLIRMRRMLLDNNPYVIGLVEFRFVSFLKPGVDLTHRRYLDSA
jgi:hypothetical protein